MNAKLPTILESCLINLRGLGLYKDDGGEIKSRRHRRAGCIVLVAMMLPSVLLLLHKAITSESVIGMSSNLVLVLMASQMAMKSFNIAKNCNNFIAMNKQIVEILILTDDKGDQKLDELKTRLNSTLKAFTIFKKIIAIGEVIVTLMAIITRKFPIDVFGDLIDEENDMVLNVSLIYLSITACYCAIVYYHQNILPYVYMSYAIGFLDELSGRLKLIGSSRELDHDELVRCIKIHQEIKKFTDEFEKAFKLILYMQNFFSQVIICSLIFNVVYAEHFFDVVVPFLYSIITILETLLPCYFGAELEKSSENLMDAIYQSEWINCELKTKKLMVKFMENLKHPMKINCYLIFDVNLELFGNIMNAAYSFYCVLNELAGL